MKKELEKRREWRNQLFHGIDSGDLDFASASKLMRKILNLNQEEFAEMVGVSKKIVSDIEVKKGNPTIDTVNKLFSPIGLQVGLVRKKMK